MATYNTFLNNKIVTIYYMLSYGEYLKYIEKIDQKTEICNFTSASDFKNDKFIDISLSNYFYETLKGILDEEILDELEILKANDIIMTGIYGSRI